MAVSAPLRGPIIIGSNQRRAAEWRAPSKEYEADLEARGQPESALVQVPERHRDRLARFGRLPADRLAELMELAARIPSQWKVRDGQTKWILKQAFRERLIGLGASRPPTGQRFQARSRTAPYRR